MTTIYLKRERFSVTGRDALQEAVEDRFRAPYVYYESVEACEFWGGPDGSGSIAEFFGNELPESAWEGRVFDQKTELRWKRDGDDFRIWVISEDDGLDGTGNGEVERTVATEERYYTIGAYEPGVDGFTELRYGRNTVFDYPVETAEAAEDARVYVKVKEYRRAEPDWASAIEAAEANSEREAEDVLAEAVGEPMLLEHRFFGMGVGSDDEE